jgi:hypothetical protein
MADDGVEGGFIKQLYGVESAELAKLFLTIQSYLHLDDTDALLAAMATAVSTADADRDPLWLMIVGPSSGSKTENIRMLEGVADSKQSDLTLAGLLTQRPKAEPSGLLSKLGNGCNAFVTVSDMSSLLNRGGGKMSGQATVGVFEALRDIYDGYFSRQMDQVETQWTGRLTLLAAVTPVIDQMRAHADALGTRWVYYRLAPIDPEQRNAVAQMVSGRKDLRQHRSDAARAVASLVTGARGRVGGVLLSTATQEVVQHGADLAAYGRVVVPRDYRGFPDGIPHWEEPGRLTGQLDVMARALTALGIGEAAVQRIIRHSALSTMPQEMRLSLEQLVDGEWTSTKAVADKGHIDRIVCRRALEGWAATGVVDERRRTVDGEVPLGEDSPDRRTREWCIDANRLPNVLKVVTKR